MRDLLAAAYQVASQQIVLPDDLNAVYSVQAWAPPYFRTGVSPLVEAALLSAANLQVREEMKPMKVVVLRSFPGEVRKPEPRDPIAFFDAIAYDYGRLHSLGGTHAETLRKVVQVEFGEPVVLENADQGTFAVDIPLNSYDKNGFRHALEQAGMPLREETQPMKIFIFSAAEKHLPQP